MAQTIKAASQYAHNYAKNWFSADCKSILIHAIIYLLPVNFFSENIYHVGYVQVNVHILIERRNIFSIETKSWWVSYMLNH